jgi:hypothetical protein
MLFKTCLALVLLAAPGPGPVPDVAENVAALLAQRDDADPALIQELAKAGTREAAEGLIAAYAAMGTVLMQREVVLALPAFDGVEDSAQLVLQKLSDVATLAPEPELHEAAIDALGRCTRNGPDFLRRIVDSSAQDVVRLRAMRRLVEIAPDGEPKWYRAVFERPNQLDDKDVKRKLKSGEKIERVDPLTELRELALERLAPSMSVNELTEIARAKERDQNDERKDGLRRIALLEIERRGDKRVGKLAADVFGDTTEKPGNRALAARMLARLEGDKVLAEFIDVGLKDRSITPPELSNTLAELVAEMRGPREEKKLAKEFAKEQPTGQLFILIALRGSDDEKFFELVVPALESENRDVAAAAAAWLGASKRAEARAPLEQALQKTNEPRVASAAVAALGVLRAEDPAWLDDLRAMAGDSRRFVRNAALGDLVQRDPRMHEDLLIEALSNEDWTTRAVALEGLLAARTRAGTGAIVGRMAAEEGRMLARFADTLWQLTGQPFRMTPKAWESWWKTAQPDFEPIALEELELLRLAEERRRLSQSTTANSFFGIRVISHRVIFILDVSGSMDERLLTKFLDEKGETRIAFAKREMIAAIQRLEKGTFFNLITFSQGIDSWTPSGMALSSPENIDSAVRYTEKILTGGGTNLFGALRAAFSDPEVDTIFVLSDGEPTVGALIESWEIRKEVATWNENRGVLINAISVGGKLNILEWLATDSGGSFTQVR